MAVTITPNLTELYDCDTTTNWSPTPTTNTEVQVEGTACNSIKVSIATTAIVFTLPGATDLSSTHIFSWMMSTTVTGLDTKANGGLRIRVEDASTNFGEWYVGGKDTYSGGFKSFVVDTTRTFDNKSATPPTLTAITKVGVTFKTTAMSSAINCFWDIARYGTGLTVGGGTTADPGTWQNIVDTDASNANAYGVVRKEGGIFFVSGRMLFGDGSGTTSTTFNDSGQIVVFEDKPVSSSLYRIELVGNSTGTNSFQLGSVVGSGDDRQGIGGGVIQTAGPSYNIDCATDIADLNTINFYGVTVKGASGGATFSGSTKTDVIGCVFENCGEVQPADAEFLNNTLVAAIDRGVRMVSTHNIKRVNYVAGEVTAAKVWQIDDPGGTPAYLDETTDFNDADVNDVDPWPAVEAVGDRFAIGFARKFSGLTINVGIAGVGGTATWKYWNGNSFTNLSGVTDNTTGFTVSGTNKVTFTVPADWATTSINSSVQLYYIAADVATVYSTNPIITQGFMGIEHHLHIPATGTYSADALKFFGFGADGAPKWHGENSSVGGVTINATNQATPSANEFENTGGGSTSVVNTVTLEVTVKDEAGVAIVSAQVGIFRDSDGTQLMNEVTIADGTATEDFNYPGADVPVSVRVRKGTGGATKYVPVTSPQTIIATGLTTTITLSEDTINTS